MDPKNKTEEGYESSGSGSQEEDAAPTVSFVPTTMTPDAVPLTQRHVWLRVIQAKNLPAVDGSSSDPIVKIRLSNEIELASRAVERQLNPLWSSDFLLPSQYCWTKPLKIDIYDHNTYAVGIALTINPLPLQDSNTSADVWLPVEGPKCSTESQLRIVASLTTQATNPPAAAVNGFRIHLERNEWLAGETIRGHIIYSLSSSKKIRGIRLNCRGFQKIKWKETTVTQTKNGASSSTSTFRAIHHIFNVKSTICTQTQLRTADFSLPPGDHVIPFEFKLPDDIPPSYESNLGAPMQVIYQVVATVDIPFAKDKVATLSFAVRQRPERMKTQLALSRKSSFKVDAGGAIRVQAELQAPLFRGMSTAKLALAIENRSSVQIARVVIYHIQKNRRYGKSGPGPMKLVSDQDAAKIARLALSENNVGATMTHTLDLMFQSDSTYNATMEGPHCPYGRLHHRLVVFLVDPQGARIFENGLNFKLPVFEKPSEPLLSRPDGDDDSQRLKPLHVAIIDSKDVALEAHPELFVPQLWVGKLEKPWGGYGPVLARSEFQKLAVESASVNEPFDEKYTIPAKRAFWNVGQPDLM